MARGRRRQKAPMRTHTADAHAQPSRELDREIEAIVPWSMAVVLLGRTASTIYLWSAIRGVGAPMRPGREGKDDSHSIQLIWKDATSSLRIFRIFVSILSAGDLYAGSSVAASLSFHQVAKNEIINCVFVPLHAGIDWKDGVRRARLIQCVLYDI